MADIPESDKPSAGKLRYYNRKTRQTEEASAEPGFFERVKEEFTMSSDDLRAIDEQRGQHLQRKLQKK